MIEFTVILLYLFSIFLISIVFKKYNEDSREIVRKIIHIGMGPLIPIAQYLQIDQKSALTFTAIISILIFLNYSYKFFPSIEDVDRKSFGTLFYCISLFILIFFFWEKDPYALMAGFLIMTFGDGLAGLIGKNLKSKNWIFFKQKKSLFGTATMFLTSLLVVCSLAYIQKYNFNINLLMIAFIATTLEQFSIIGIDNLLVPLASAIYFNIFVTNL